ncbi:MAG: DUF2490 domain-containing protein [Bryobacteraceae bacterium]|nr:DUF2490 domain-containing protein [Bryobacteraceae bacterium]
MTAGLLLWCAVLAGPPAAAQPNATDHNLHGWLVYNGDHGLSNRWGIHLEGQFRRHNLFNSWQQLLLRPGVNFSLSRNVMLTGGYAYIRTHRYGEYPFPARFPEHRVYQQAIIRSKTGRIEWQQRPRLEQRWLGVVPGPDLRPISWRYQGRFRYLSRAAIGLGRNEPTGWYIALQDEIFLNFGENKGARVFDQNRVFAAIGRRFGKAGNLEWGYMNQLVAQRNGRILEHNHTLQAVFISSLRFRK